MSEKLKVGVIGTGVLGRFHTKLYSENKKVELVGVYDAMPAAAEKVAKEFGTKVFSSEEALADACDALTIAVPATMHHDSAMPLIAKGKHILVEKPIDSDVAAAREMVEAAKEKGIVFAVGHVERFNPAMDYLEKHRTKTLFIEAHRLAKYPPPRPGQLRRGTEVSVVLDLMIHDIDLVLRMVNAEIEKIDVVGIPVLSGSEDIVNARIKFVNGSCASLTASRVSQEPLRRFRVFQDDCYISMDYGNHFGMVLKRNRLGLARKDVDLDDKNALAAELEDFIAAVNKTKETGIVTPTKVPGDQGLRALRMAVAIEREARRYNDQYGFKFAPCTPDEMK